MKQQSMFTTQDLPLFSGTPMKAAVRPFIQKETYHQPSLSKCRFCHDTGKIGSLFCGSCETGHTLRRSAQ